MKKTAKNIVLSNLVLIATLAIGQAYADTTIKNKGVLSKNNSTVSTSNTAVKASPTKKTTTLPTTTNKLKQNKINPTTVPLTRPAVATQPALRKDLGASTIGQQQNNLNDMKELNGFKNYNQLKRNGVNNNPSIGIGKTLPRGRTGVNKGVGSGGSSAVGSSLGVVRDYRGGISVFTSSSGGSIMFPTPEGGTHHNPHSGGLAEMHFDGSMYTLETNNGLMYIPVGSTTSETAPPGARAITYRAGSATGGQGTNKPSTTNKPATKNTSTAGTKDTKDTSTADTKNTKDTSTADTKDTSTKDTKDTSTADTKDTGKDGADKMVNGSGGVNRSTGTIVIDDIMAKKTGEKTEVESTTPEPCGEDGGASVVAQPGQGEQDCVSGSISVSTEGEEGSAGPTVENNLHERPTNTVGPDAVVNPGRFDEQRPNRNHALDTLEDIEGTVNPG